MPKAKRAKLVTLSTTKKKTKADKMAIMDKIKSSIEPYKYIYIIHIDNMRNLFLKKFREDFCDSKMFFGKNKLMAKALSLYHNQSSDMQDFCMKIVGNNTGLLFSNTAPTELQQYCEKNIHLDYGRAGTIATSTVIIPQGNIMRNEEPMPHTLEGQLRESGLPVIMKKGVLMLDADYKICQEGEVLNAHQAKLLKVFFIQMAEFRIVPKHAVCNGKQYEL